MAMKVGGGGRGGPTADINMTPMIDIMLVLLIIFMVVQVGLQRGVSVQVPPIQQEQVVVNQTIDQIVLQVEPGPQYLLNTEIVAPEGLEGRLREVYSSRARKVIFVKGAEEVAYGNVIFAVDAARAAGIDIVGFVPRKK